MKSDEDVRMISAEAPVLFAKVRLVCATPETDSLHMQFAACVKPFGDCQKLLQIAIQHKRQW